MPRAWRAFVPAMLVWALSCTKPANEPPRADPATRADATASTTPSGSASGKGTSSTKPEAAASGDDEDIAAWTDPKAVAGLARSCRFDPVGDRDAGPLNEAERGHPLSCRLRFDQACVADPCWHEDYEQCRQGCSAKCNTCSDGCVGSCESCKASCKDDACKQRCAASCGECKQKCLTTRDTCGTAECTRVHEACRDKLVRGWIDKGCDAVCRKYDRCFDTCNSDKPPPNCMDKCDAIPGAKACHANPMLCGEMVQAPERRKVDPKWVNNRCDAVCKQVWDCAVKQCDKTACGEPIKAFEACAAKTPGVDACSLRQAQLGMCPEPGSP